MSLSDKFKALPAPVQRNALALKGIQKKGDQIRREFEIACKTLEKTFQPRYDELYRQREMIVSGLANPKPADIAEGLKAIQEDNDDYEAPSLNPAEAAAIPEFWLTAFSNHVEISDLVSERDSEALKYLTDIQLSFLSPSGPRPDFKLTFIFNSNDYFSNATLEKKYYYKEDSDSYDGYSPDRAKGTKIRWKSGKSLTANNGNDDEKSFFEFFTPLKPPNYKKRGSDKEEDDDSDDEEMEEYEELLEEDFDRGEIFKDELVAEAVNYFMGGDDSDDESFDWDEDKTKAGGQRGEDSEGGEGNGLSTDSGGDGSDGSDDSDQSERDGPRRRRKW